MTDREKLIGILRVPIYPHELADPAEVVADYLLDNDVVPVVRCKDCKHWKECESSLIGKVMCCKGQGSANIQKSADDFCSYGERKDNG